MKQKLLATGLMLFLFASFQAFTARFTFSLPGSDIRCLDARLFIVDKWDKDITNGDLVAFTFDKEGDPYYNKGAKFIKIAAATAGDSISITPNQYNVNEVPHPSTMIFVAKTLGINAHDLTRTEIIPQNQFFAVGETINSYDSRFFGNINTKEIIGKAYAVF